MSKYHDALRTALRLNDRSLIESTFAACADPSAKKQLCYLLARQGVTLDLEDGDAAVRGLQPASLLASCVACRVLACRSRVCWLWLPALPAA